MHFCLGPGVFSHRNCRTFFALISNTFEFIATESRCKPLRCIILWSCANNFGCPNVALHIFKTIQHVCCATINEKPITSCMDEYLNTTSQYKGHHHYIICSLHSITPLYTQNPSINHQPLLNLVHTPRSPYTPDRPLRLLAHLNRNIERLHNRRTASPIQTV
jgi:hypothetical protein